MTTKDEAVLWRVDGAVGIVELNRPDKFNCLSSAVIAGLNAALDRFASDDAVRAVLVRGNGKHFCTGADLDEVLAARNSREALAAFMAGGHAVLRRFEALPLPVVAAVHGLALAGGLEVMMACDVVYAAASARFGDQHARFGLVPGWGGSQRLPRLVGLRRALELMYSARWLDAEEAKAWGLVNQVVPEAELEAAALGFCRELAARNREGLAAMKRFARQGLDLTLGEGLALEEREVVEAMMTDNVSEGLAAFQERREPNFA